MCNIFFIFLLQKIDNKVINKKAKIAEIIKSFKQNLELKSSEMNERQLKIFKKDIERNEKIVNNKDKTDIEYISDELDTIKRVFNGFVICTILIIHQKINLLLLKLQIR